MSEVAPFAEQLRSHFNPAFVDGLMGNLDPDWFPASLTPAMRAYTEHKIASLHEVLEAMGHPDDAEELYRMLALHWLELKFEWTRYNNVMNYQVMLRGQADPTIFAKGGICSGILAVVEGVLAPDDVEQLVNLSAEPLLFGKPDLTRVRDFLARHEAVSKDALRKVSAAAESMKLDDLKRAVANLQRATARTVELTEAPAEFVWHELSDAVRNQVQRDGWRYVLRGVFDPSGHVSMASHSALRQGIVTATTLLLCHDTEASADDRMALDKPAHITVEVAWQQTESGGLAVTVSADGAGGLEGALGSGEAAELWAALQASVGTATVSSTVGESTAVAFSLGGVVLAEAS